MEEQQQWFFCSCSSDPWLMFSTVYTVYTDYTILRVLNCMFWLQQEVKISCVALLSSVVVKAPVGVHQVVEKMWRRAQYTTLGFFVPHSTVQSDVISDLVASGLTNKLILIRNPAVVTRSLSRIMNFCPSFPLISTCWKCFLLQVREIKIRTSGSAGAVAPHILWKQC